MYKAEFVSDKGLSYLFGSEGHTAFSMDVGNGMSVNLGISQGFSQVGEFVDSQSIGGKPISVKGVVYGNVEQKKNELRNAFAPFTSGKLIFNKTHFIRVYVEESPTFSARKGDGRFTMLLYAPKPLFQNITESVYKIGEIQPLFSFPVNYSEKHIFGKTVSPGFAMILNNGDVPVPLQISLMFHADCKNPKITDNKNLKFFKLNGTFSAGSVVNIYRDDFGILKVVQESEENSQDIINMVDEDSDFFEITVGSNPISVTADVGSGSIETIIKFNESVVSVYET